MVQKDNYVSFKLIVNGTMKSLYEPYHWADENVSILENFRQYLLQDWVRYQIWFISEKLFFCSPEKFMRPRKPSTSMIKPHNPEAKLTLYIWWNH